jgi:hypothetical protein
MGEIIELQRWRDRCNAALLVKALLRRGEEVAADLYYGRQRLRMLDALMTNGVPSIEARERVLAFVEAANAHLQQRVDAPFWATAVAARARRSAIGSLSGVRAHERKLAKAERAVGSR